MGLLLQLIEKEELDITEISLSKIAEEYIEYIKNSVDIKAGDLADFLVVAARLLLIKTKALLPYLHPEEEEEIKEFEDQLRMYKEFLEAMKKIEAMIGNKKFMFEREWNRQVVLANLKIFFEPKNLTASDLSIVFNDLLNRLQPTEKLEEGKLERKINIEEKIVAIQRMLLNRIRVGFNKILAGAKSKTEVIVSFLALLELIKQRQIFAAQNELFEEIEISKDESRIKNYEYQVTN